MKVIIIFRKSVKMPLFKKIKAKAKNCRGGGDDFAVKAFEEDYSAWEAGI